MDQGAPQPFESAIVHDPQPGAGHADDQHRPERRCEQIRARPGTLVTSQRKHLGRTTCRRHKAPAILLALVTAPIIEIALCAVVYALAVMDYFCCAAETCFSLGHGDIFPLGELRLIASISPLNGILLLA